MGGRVEGGTTTRTGRRHAGLRRTADDGAFLLVALGVLAVAAILRFLRGPGGPYPGHDER